MSEEKIPTTGELLENFEPKSLVDSLGSVMIAFARMHVLAALKAAADKADFKSINSREESLPNGTDRLKVINENMPDDPKEPWYVTFINKSSILNAYPPENIK